MQYAADSSLSRVVGFCSQLAGAGALALCVPLVVLAAGLPVALVVNLAIAVFVRL